MIIFLFAKMITRITVFRTNPLRLDHVITLMAEIINEINKTNTTWTIRSVQANLCRFKMHRRKLQVRYFLYVFKLNFSSIPLFTMFLSIFCFFFSFLFCFYKLFKWIKELILFKCLISIFNSYTLPIGEIQLLANIAESNWIK